MASEAATALKEEDDDFYGPQGEEGDAAALAREVATLEREHINAGFREGSSAARDSGVQPGFDAGFLCGARIAAAPGFWMGVCAITEAFYVKNPGKESRGDSEACSADLKEIAEAREELEEQAERLAQDAQALSVDRAREACTKALIIESPKDLPP